MATYVYFSATGELYSWNPNDSDPVAPADVLEANGLEVVSGLPPLDATHAWDAASATVVTVEAPVAPQPILTSIWILRFTPVEFQGIMASTDATVQQFMYSINHTTQIDLTTQQIIDGVTYLVTVGLLISERQPDIMAPPAGINGP